MPPRNQTNEKPRDRRGTVKRLLTYLWDFKWLMLLAIALTVLSNLFQLIGPTLSAGAIDAVEGGVGRVDFETVFYYARLMALFFVASSLLGYALAVLMIQLSQKIVYKMRAQVFDKLMALPVSFFDRNQTGDILSRISYDIDTVNASLSNDVTQILTSLITVFGSLIMMLRLSPALVGVFAVTVPASVLLTRYMTRRVRPLFSLRSRRLAELNGFVEEMASGLNTIRAYGREDVVLSRFDQHNERAVEAYYQADYYGSMTGPSVNFINNLSLSLISVFGALMYLAGALTLGDVSAFVLYSRKFSGPINEAANIFSEMQSALAAAERVFNLLDEPVETPDRPDARALAATRGQVDMREVSFGYTQARLVLKQLSLIARPGSLVAIVGETGSGKTTLINLLMRFYDVTGGSIEIDGGDIRDLKRKSLRGAFAMVLQDSWLFSGTVYENIALPRYFLISYSTKQEISSVFLRFFGRIASVLAYPTATTTRTRPPLRGTIFFNFSSWNQPRIQVERP